MSNPLSKWICTGSPKGQPYNHAKKLVDQTVTVPVPNHQEIKIGTLQSIIRQSQLTKEFFETGR